MEKNYLFNHIREIVVLMIKHECIIFNNLKKKTDIIKYSPKHYILLMKMSFLLLETFL